MKGHMSRLDVRFCHHTPGVDPPRGWDSFWVMWIVAASVQPPGRNRKGAGSGLIVGWGYDSDAPLRPWPQFGVDQRASFRHPDAGVLSWVVWCGFLLAMQSRDIAPTDPTPAPPPWVTEWMDEVLADDTTKQGKG